MITADIKDEYISDLVNNSSTSENLNGTIMYHYCSTKTVEKILQPDMLTLRFTRADCMNDPEEGKHAIGFFRHAAQSQYDLEEITDDYLEFLLNVEQIARDYYSEDRQDDMFRLLFGQFCLSHSYYMCCFSDYYDLLPMWNYYLKDGKYEGVNIGINSKLIEQPHYKCKKYEIFTTTVIYSNFFEVCVNLIMKYKNVFSKNGDNREIAYLFSCFLEKYKFKVKIKTFEHERETRAILKVDAGFVLDEKEYFDQGFKKVYIDMKFEKDAFRLITICFLNKERDIEKNLNALLSDRKYKQIVKRSRIKNRF